LPSTNLLCGHAGGATTTANTTQYWMPGSCCVITTTTEANHQVVIRSPGTFSKLGVRIITNGVASGTSTITLRKNAADATNVASIGATLTGWFEDTTHTDAIVAGDKIDFKSIHGAATGTLTLTMINITYAADTDTVTRLVSLTGRATIAEPLTRYFALNHGSATFSATEAPAKCRIRKAGTFKNLAVNLSANAITTASTVTMRKNAAATTVTKSITASTTGFFEDTTNSFTVVAGDDVDYEIVTPSVAGTPTLTVQSFQCDFVDVSDAMFINADVGTNSFNAATTQYTTLTGGTGWDGTESKCQLKIKDNYIFSELTILVNTNTITAASTVTLRKNTADGNEIVSITASSTGIFSDSTHTDVVVTDDLVDVKLVGGSTGTGLNYYGIFAFTTSYIPQTIWVEWEES
jgi:hypothetical protein